jgi:hypothetical protein
VAASPPAPRPGLIPDSQFHRLTPEQQSGYARVKKSSAEGGAEWIARDKLPAESTDPAKPATGDSPAAATADSKLKVGDYELSSDVSRQCRMCGRER